jgi:uncharacterized alpha/beta hydrolase family protein
MFLSFTKSSQTTAMSSTKPSTNTTDKNTRSPLIREILSEPEGEVKEWTSKDMKQVLRKLLDQYNWECYRSELEFE